MKRRSFFQALLGGIGVAVAGRHVQASRRTVLLQESQVAGFEYYSGETIWPSLRVGQRLQLVREPANAFDRDAVSVYFLGEKLATCRNSGTGPSSRGSIAASAARAAMKRFDLIDGSLTKFRPY